MSRLQTLLLHRGLVPLLATAAVVLSLPAMWVGWLADDHWHRAAVLEPSALPYSARLAPTCPLDLFRFLDGDPQRTGLMMDMGVVPWWTYAKAKVAFWRPLAAATHWLDFRCWPGSPAAAHAQSLLWFALLVGGVGVLYRRIMGLTVAAGLATVLYAIDDAHGTAVGFVANRNALMAAFFGVLALVVHDRWRRDGWRAGVLLGPLLLAMSLLSAEAGAATVAYLLAHAVFVDRASWVRRLLALLPYLLVVVAWRVLWVLVGYGVYSGVQFYVDPTGEPLRYALAAVQRAPLLLLGQWGFPPSDAAIFLGDYGQRLLSIGATALVVLIGLAVVPVLRRSSNARFWAGGMILSLLPVCATLPMDRLLTFVGIGAFGLIGEFLHAWWSGSRPPRGRWAQGATRPVAVALVAVHLIAAPIFLPFRAGNPMGPNRLVKAFHVTTPMGPQVEHQDVVIVNGPVAMLAGYVQPMRALEGEPVPRHVRILGPSQAAVDVRRVDERTLVLRPDGGYLAWPYDEGFRGTDHAMALHERVELPGMTAQVTDLTSDGRPAEVAFRFAASLTDRQFRWLCWDTQSRTYVPFVPPPVGEAVRLPRCWWRPLS
ncbi:MAG TPA: hypothetical protein VMZ31_04535 [Phycisphaerae bacterium]|nr:hypothetical protein [Phycisphaerae bacterium]